MSVLIYFLNNANLTTLGLTSSCAVHGIHIHAR